MSFVSEDRIYTDIRETTRMLRDRIRSPVRVNVAPLHEADIAIPSPEMIRQMTMLSWMSQSQSQNNSRLSASPSPPPPPAKEDSAVQATPSPHHAATAMSPTNVAFRPQSVETTTSLRSSAPSSPMNGHQQNSLPQQQQQPSPSRKAPSPSSPTFSSSAMAVSSSPPAAAAVVGRSSATGTPTATQRKSPQSVVGSSQPSSPSPVRADSSTTVHAASAAASLPLSSAALPNPAPAMNIAHGTVMVSPLPDTNDVTTLKRKLASYQDRILEMQRQLKQSELLNEQMKQKIEGIARQEDAKKKRLDGVQKKLQSSSLRDVIEMYEHSRLSLDQELAFLRQEVVKSNVYAELRELLCVERDEEIAPVVEKLVRVAEAVPKMELWIRDVCLACNTTPDLAIGQIEEWKLRAASSYASSPSAMAPELKLFMNLFDLRSPNDIIPKMNELYLSSVHFAAADQSSAKSTSSESARRKASLPHHSPVVPAEDTP